MRLASSFFAAGFLLLVCTPCFGAECTARWLPGLGLPGVNGKVSAVIAWDPDGTGPQPEKLVVGGTFTVAGTVVANNIAMWDGQTWSSLGSGLNGPVTALAVYGGRVVVSGNFTTAGGVPASRIARWTGSSWQSLGAGLNYGCIALIEYRNELIAGGYFTSAGGQAIKYLARWNGSTWSSLGGGTDYGVESFALCGQDLIVGGGMTKVGSVSARYVASWNGSVWRAMSWPANGVCGVAVYGGQIVACDHTSVMQWDGAAWQKIGGTDSWIDAICVCNGELYIAGQFSYVTGTVAAQRVARWNGSIWQSLSGGKGVNNTVWTLGTWRGQLVAGGDFTTAGDIAAWRVACWNGSDFSSLGHGFDGYIGALAVHDDALYAGGEFLSVGSTGANLVASWNGREWNSLDGGLTGFDSAKEVYCIGSYAGKLVVGGYFWTNTEPQLLYIVTWDGINWGPLGSGLRDDVGAIGEYNGELIAAGQFSSSSSSTGLDRIARWDGTAWRQMGYPNTYAFVYSFVVYNGELIAGGSISTASGAPANNLVRWNGSAWECFHGGTNGRVNFLAIYEGDLVVGGEFSSVGGVSANCIARWDGTQWLPLGSGVKVGGERTYVSCLCNYDGELIAGGSFTLAGDLQASRIARWNGSSWQALGSGLDGVPDALTVYRNELQVGGNFMVAGGQGSAFWARWGPTPPTIAAHPESKMRGSGAAVSFSVIASDTGVLNYQWRKDGLNLTDSERISGATAPTLNIASSTPMDAGGYDVLVSSPCASGLSKVASLTICTPAAPDLDRDCDVDVGDVALFAGCATGAGVSYSAAVPVSCALEIESSGVLPADFDHDGDVDPEDFAVMQRCLAAPQESPRPECSRPLP